MSYQLHGLFNMYDVGSNKNLVKVKLYLCLTTDQAMDGTDLNQERDQWRAVVNKVMNLPVP